MPSPHFVHRAPELRKSLTWTWLAPTCPPCIANSICYLASLEARNQLLIFQLRFVSPEKMKLCPVKKSIPLENRKREHQKQKSSIQPNGSHTLRKSIHAHLQEQIGLMLPALAHGPALVLALPVHEDGPRLVPKRAAPVHPGALAQGRDPRAQCNAERAKGGAQGTCKARQKDKG